MKRLLGGLVAFVVVASSCDPPTAPPARTFAQVQLIAKPASPDTFFAEPTQPVVVEIRDSTGALLPNGDVTFTSWQGVGFVLVKAVDEPVFGNEVTVRADSHGRASALLRFGNLAGTAGLKVTVQQTGAWMLMQLEVRAPSHVAAAGVGDR